MTGILKSYKIVSSFSFNRKSLKNSIFLTFSVILLSSSFVASDSNNFELFPLAFAAVSCTSTGADETCTMDDTVSITDTVATNFVFLSDSVAITDTVAATGDLTISLNDSVTVTDTLATDADLTQPLSDSVAVSETIVTAADLTQPLSDSVAVTETIVNSVGLTQTLSDSVAATDSIVASGTITLSNIDTTASYTSVLTRVSVPSSTALIETITVTAGTSTPILDYSAFVSSGSATITNVLNITASNTSITVDVDISSGTTISGTDWDGELTLPTEKSTGSVSISGVNTNFVMEFGDPDVTLTFAPNPIKLTLAGQAGRTAHITEGSTTSEITTICNSINPGIVSNIPGAFPQACKIDSGDNLVLLTETASTFSTGSSTAISGGGGGGDSTPPSITVGFDQNEFPLKYDGVNYQSHQLDSIHTAMIETGDELQATLSVYENSGVGNIQHVELYLNQFGSRILNDLTETIVIYDEQSGLEIIDPHNLIATANVIPSVSGNKAVFDFVVVFENEIPQSDIMFRVWDIKRNSMEIHLPDALIVEISEQPSGIISPEPEPGVSDAESESEPIVPEAAPEVPEPVPGISEPVPKDELPTKTWTSGQLSVLKQWGGYDVETSSDIDVLSKFGIKGEKIPPYIKQFVKWILKDQISQEEFVNALLYLRSEGLLSNSVGKQSLDVNSQMKLEEFTLEKEPIDSKMNFEFDEIENGLYTKANLGDLEDKIRTLRALANNAEIQNELITSNMEFQSLTDPDDLIDQRDSEWQRNPKTVTPFMESLMNNESALIAKAIIEHDKEDLVPLISIIITNAYGVNTAITEKTQDYKQSDEQWWGKTKAGGVYMMSGSGSEEYTGLYTTEISLSINDREGNFIGIIKAVVNFEKALLLD